MSESLMVWFTGIIAFATVAYVVFTLLLWKETQKSVEAAKNMAGTTRESLDLAGVTWLMDLLFRVQTDIEGARQQQQPEAYIAGLEKFQAWFADLVFHRLSTIVEVEPDRGLREHIGKLEEFFTSQNINLGSVPWFQRLLKKLKGKEDMDVRIRLHDFGVVFDLNGDGSP
ncbi:MAG: hypothetical protein M1305_07390 [Candidatus Marsarchaeota archaeon]|nr:hypothetical protein [Candidatus Marsarchaeota archaeon]